MASEHYISPWIIGMKIWDEGQFWILSDLEPFIQLSYHVQVSWFFALSWTGLFSHLTYVWCLGFLIRFVTFLDEWNVLLYRLKVYVHFTCQSFTFSYLFPWQAFLCVEISVQDVVVNRKFSYLGLVVLWYLEPVHHIDRERNVGLTVKVEITMYLAFWIALVCRA